MLSKRVVAVSSDKAFAKRLAAGLQAAGGTVETAASLDELAKGEIQADLVAVHQTDPKSKIVTEAAGRLKKDAALIVVIPSSNLEQVVAAMQVPRVAATLIADDLSPSMLAACATRLLYGDVFGLEKLVPWGVRVYSQLVGDYQEKSVAISSVSDFAASMGVRRKYREAIEQCLDELLMNALYDAPVDSSGKQMFADVPTKTRISLRMEQKAVVQYACDGNTFSMSVRDSFGALKPDTVVRYLDKCLHAEQQIDRKTGGAGLGLYIIANAATQFLYNIYPGVATEAITTFDLTAAKVQLKEFGAFQERIDSSGRLVAGPSRLVGAGAPGAAPMVGASKAVVGVLGGAVVLLGALIGLVAWPRFVGAPKGDLSVTTVPAGATLELDGRSVGTTATGAVVIEDLEVDKSYKLTARLEGYEPHDEIVGARKGATSTVAFTLTPRATVVTLETDPPGATARLDGAEVGTTPVTLSTMAPGSEHELILEKTGYATVKRSVRAPAAGRESSVVSSLVMASNFGSVNLETTPPGAEILQNGELLAGLTTPVAAHLIQSGKPYTFTFKAKGFQPETRTMRVDAGARGVPVTVPLKAGGGVSIDVNVPEARITVAGAGPLCANIQAPLKNCPVSDGKYRVQMRSTRPFLSDSFEVNVQGEHVEKVVELGFVEAGRDVNLQLPGAPKGTRRVALPEGTHKVQVVNAKGEAQERTVKVTAGRTTTVE